MTTRSLTMTSFKALTAMTMLAATAMLAQPAHAAANPDVPLTIVGKDGKVLLKMTESEVVAASTKSFQATTPWEKGEKVTYRGVLFRDVLKKAGVKSPAMLKITALNGFVVDFPVEDAEKYDVILTTFMNNVRITPRNKGPLFIMYPMDDVPALKTGIYFNRSAWQIDKIYVK